MCWCERKRKESTEIAQSRMRLRIVATYAFVCLLILGAGQVAADDCGPGEFVTKCCCEERSESCVTQWCAGPESETHARGAAAAAYL